MVQTADSFRSHEFPALLTGGLLTGRRLTTASCWRSAATSKPRRCRPTAGNPHFVESVTREKMAGSDGGRALADGNGSGRSHPFRHDIHDRHAISRHLGAVPAVVQRASALSLVLLPGVEGREDGRNPTNAERQVAIAIADNVGLPTRDCMP